ncbi:MAG: hypothetical protein ACJ8FY_13700 [Gemmataceae bacterium]
MSLDVMRDRVQRAIAKLEALREADGDDLAQAVAECLRQVLQNHASPRAYVDMSYEMLETL